MIITEPHLVAFYWIVLIGGIYLTHIIIRRPCDGSKQAIIFYLTLPFIAAIAILSLPFAYYKMIELLWEDQLKRKRLQVKS